MQQPRPAGHQRASDQRLLVPALPLPGHHVALALQLNAGVPRRPHRPDAHAHRQSHAELGQLHEVSSASWSKASSSELWLNSFLPQIWQQGGVHVVHEPVPGARVERHAALPAGDLKPRDDLQHGGLRGLHRPGQGALHAALAPVRGRLPDGPGIVFSTR